MKRTLILLSCCIALSTFAQRPSHPNSIKYADTSIPNATGRSGSASIEAQALLNSDDSADVYVTAGAPGTLAKVQLSIPTGGDPIKLNYNNLENGTFAASNVNGLIRHGSLGIQANVRDVDGARTDVVSVNETVKLRPDLAITALVTPGVPVTGTVGRMRVVIEEQNGDVGARATVRLFIAGVEVDRAENIWVNAGGRVTVAFSPIIEAEQGYTEFKAVLENVSPGDYDESNNTRSDIQMVWNVLDHFYSWSASATEEQFDRYGYTKTSWTEQSYDYKGIGQIYEFSGLIRAAVNLDTMSMHASGETDGNPLFDVTTNEFYSFNTPGGRCYRSWTNDPEVTACFGNSTSSVDVDVFHADSDAIYRSWGWRTRSSPFGPEEPLYVWDQTTEEHTLQNRFGSSVALEFTLTDGTNHWTARPFLSPLQVSQSNSDRPYRCTFNRFLNQTECREGHDYYTYKKGSASGWE